MPTAAPQGGILILLKVLIAVSPNRYPRSGKLGKMCLRAGDTPEAVAKMIDLGLDYIPTNVTVPCV